jgi:hypothetical protein
MTIKALKATLEDRIWILEDANGWDRAAAGEWTHYEIRPLRSTGRPLGGVVVKDIDGRSFFLGCLAAVGVISLVLLVIRW